MAINGATSIGRLTNNDIVIPDETISRRHCIIEARDSEFILRDKGSSNGCRINGEKISVQTISAGDSVRIGKVDLKFFVMAVSEDAYQLAELLVQNGLLSPKEAKNALNELAKGRSRKTQGTLGQILIDTGKVSKDQLEDSLDNLDRTTKRDYRVKVGLVRETAGPSVPTRGNPIPEAMGGKKTSIIRKPELEKPMPPASEGDGMALLDEAAPPPLSPGRSPGNSEPLPQEYPLPYLDSVPVSDAELSLDDSDPPPQPVMSFADEAENDEAMMSGFASRDSLFGQMSVCSGCKEVIMMSDVTSGEAVYVDSKLYCKKCAAAQ